MKNQNMLIIYISINFKFYQPGDAPAALTLRPDSFEPDEASAFQDLPPATQRLGGLNGRVIF